MDSKKLAYSIKEAVHATGVSRSALYDAIAQNQLRAVKRGARTLILADDLNAFLFALPTKQHEAGHRGTRDD